MVAMNTPAGTEQYNVATAICFSRGVPPFSMLPNGLLAWQSVIAEAYMMKKLMVVLP